MLHKNKAKSKKRPVLKFFLITGGALITLGFALVLWVYFSLFAGPGVMDISDYHPFRWPEAKERYLEWYDERASHWPVVSDSRLVDTSFGRTHVRIGGPVDAPPLVLLPGGGATSMMWLPNIEALSEHYRTYAVDNIYNVGRSVYTRAIETPDDLVNWLDELFSALKLGDDINLMGLSYGGWLCSQYALRFSDRLNKVILLAPAATVLPFSQEFLKRGALTLLPARHFIKDLMYWLLEDLVNKDEAGKKLVDTAIDDAVLARQCFKFKMLVQPTVLRDEELQSIKIPALFLVGENEKIYSAQEAVQRLHEVAPQIETEIIPDCGHDLTMVQAETVNKRILQFLKH